jgi:hypothetical protein
LSAAVGISLYGLTGPFAASLMQSIGIRRTMLGGLALKAVPECTRRNRRKARLPTSAYGRIDLRQPPRAKGSSWAC